MSKIDLLPSALLRNPDLLLCNKPMAGYVYSAEDGLVGALLDDKGEMFITSPNYRQILAPPLGGDRKLYMRENFRYGPDDPVQWPQAFVPYMAHLVALPIPPENESNPLHVMYWIPGHHDFTQESTSIFTGLGRLHSSKFKALNDLCQALLDRSNACVRKDDSTFVLEYSTVLRDYLHRIHTILTDFGTMVKLVRGLQRIYLEFLALLDYLEEFQPRMDGAVVSSPNDVTPVMGCFVHTQSHAEMMLRAGIRCWFIRPTSALLKTKIRRRVTIQQPDDLIPMTALRNATWIHVGSSSDPSKYRAIYLQLSKLLSYPDPFASTCAPDDPNTPIPEPPRKKLKTSSVFVRPRGSRDSRSQANTKGTPSNSNSSGRDKFKEPVSELYPPPIPAWKHALAAVNQRGLIGNTKGVAGYMLPEPAGIVAIQSQVRQMAMFESWLKYRTALLYQASSTLTAATPHTATFWRKLLCLEFEKGSAGGSSQNTGPSQLRDEVQNYIQLCIDNVNNQNSHQTLLVATEQEIEPSWRGTPFPALGPSEFEQVLWELCELGFRYEVVALDGRLAARPTSKLEPRPQSNQPLIQPSEPRQLKIEACFAGMHHGSLFDVNLNTANLGLADYDWIRRAPFILALQKLMRSWKVDGRRPASLDISKFAWSEADVVGLERDVAQFYTQSFFDQFHRAAVIPRRLSTRALGSSLMPPPFLLPDPPALTVLNPRPNIYYDLSSIEPIPQPIA
ncbi:hypothetical protein BDN72DRAFT_904875 [Pluteus cervinus]|uniref:Uncharacterized protein n=1 Tax=Pluteus cervinus TaxID=181527 RepID=A0ACD3A3X3_9AGAR|nr:hypothetical protein BDN72DRAFT_904875 [Pluteus cervinus]